jgi:energy-coupling factor transporter transmembrane protein EcfT
MHPSARILLLLILALMVYGFEQAALQLSFMAMMLTLLIYDLIHPNTAAISLGIKRFRAIGEFFKLLKRVRYIVLVLMLVYAYNTPGEYVSGWIFSLAPTYEGVHAGIEQALRLALIIAGLALLLTTTDRDQMIAGLYWLAKPFRFPAFQPERFAVRLWLTLHYVEHRQPDASAGSIRQLLQIEQLLRTGDAAPEQIVLQNPAIRSSDIMAVAAMTALGAYVLCV